MSMIIEPRPLSGACPSFFRALCLEASGGGKSYSTAGGELTRHLATLSPDDCPSDRWCGRLASLASHVRAADEASTLGWFDRNLTRCMELVSRDGRRAFVRGVFHMVETDPGVLSA